MAEEPRERPLAQLVTCFVKAQVVFPSNLTGVYEDHGRSSPTFQLGAAHTSQELSQRLLGLSISDFSNCSIVQCATSESNRSNREIEMSMQCPRNVHAMFAICFQFGSRLSGSYRALAVSEGPRAMRVIPMRSFPRPKGLDVASSSFGPFGGRLRACVGQIETGRCVTLT